ncbi:GumC family protein [Pseudorhodobacter turbinis]|nr:Wzz/FepE/Etk N-terminal domain-containing protein [Pseudorhodobacter turbinis]
MDFKYYFSLFLRRVHWFLLFLVIGSTIGLTLAKVLPPVYRAQARLLVESEQIPDSLAASTVQTEATEQLEIIQQRILTRDTLIEMANRLNIYGATEGRPAQRMDATKMVDDMRDRIEIVTTGGSTPRGPARATLVAVSFEAPTAAMAATVTNELVTLILREDVSMRTGVARQTLSFFEQELSRLDKELADRGTVILNFKEANQQSLPDSLDFRRSQQAANQERLTDLERQEAALRDARARAVRLYEAFGGEGGVLPRDQTKEQQQLQGLQDELAAQLSILSPENPKITLLKARIKAVEAIVEAQQARSGLSQEGVPQSAYETQLAEIDGQLEYITAQQTRVQATLDNLRQSIEATPGNAITLDTLERDYANVRKQYDLAVANKARAETGDIIESLRQGQRISIVEQAVTPTEPQSPNRPVVAAGGIAGGMMLGLGLVFLLTVLERGVRRPADITAKLGITPFVTLPYFRTKEEIARRRAIIIAILVAGLVVIPIGLWAVNSFIMPLDQMIARLTGRG